MLKIHRNNNEQLMYHYCSISERSLREKKLNEFALVCQI